VLRYRDITDTRHLGLAHSASVQIERRPDGFALQFGNANALLPAEPARTTTRPAASEPATAASDTAPEGMTLAEFAAWAGIDRREASTR
jgi:hypothetical protein